MNRALSLMSGKKVPPIPKRSLAGVATTGPVRRCHGQRERDFCAAVGQLNQQPLSETRLDDVDIRLKALLTANVKDEIDSASRYWLGRMIQLYRTETDVGLAA